MRTKLFQNIGISGGGVFEPPKRPSVRHCILLTTEYSNRDVNITTCLQLVPRLKMPEPLIANTILFEFKNNVRTKIFNTK
jgi:hypothetical protein